MIHRKYHGNRERKNLNRKPRRGTRLLLLVLYATAASLVPCLFLSLTALAQDAAGFFRTNCYSCHTIGGGRVTGPDLRNVTSRQDREWLVNFIQNPKQVIDSRDPYALQLMKEARNVIMPTIPNLNESMAQALIDLIEKESRLEESNFMGLQISDRPLSEERIEKGKHLFLGRIRLSNGGPPCVSCHSAGSSSRFGGGRIGPDLTKVYERIGGRQALATWLLAPGNETMQALFRDRPLTPEDIGPLSEFLEFSAKHAKEADGMVASLNFLLVGLLLSSMGLAALGAALRRNGDPRENGQANQEQGK